MAQTLLSVLVIFGIEPMNAATRKKLFAYAIPVDLVVVAMGVGLIAPNIEPLALIGVFVAAVAISAWKSGWIGALAAMVLSAALLYFFFNRTVQHEQIGWFVAAGIIVSIPLAALSARARSRKRTRDEQADAYVPMIAVPRSVEETAAAAILPVTHDDGNVAARERHARAEGEKSAAERFAIEKKKLEDEFHAPASRSSRR